MQGKQGLGRNRTVVRRGRLAGVWQSVHGTPALPQRPRHTAAQRPYSLQRAAHDIGHPAVDATTAWGSRVQHAAISISTHSTHAHTYTVRSRLASQEHHLPTARQAAACCLPRRWQRSEAATPCCKAHVKQQQHGTAAAEHRGLSNTRARPQCLAPLPSPAARPLASPAATPLVIARSSASSPPLEQQLAWCLLTPKSFPPHRRALCAACSSSARPDSSLPVYLCCHPPSPSSSSILHPLSLPLVSSCCEKKCQLFRRPARMVRSSAAAGWKSAAAVRASRCLLSASPSTMAPERVAPEASAMLPTT